MLVLHKNPVLEYGKGTLEYIRKKYGFNTVQNVDEAINLLEQWIQHQKHFMKKDFKRRYLEVTIMMCKGSSERAKKSLDQMCTFRTHLPQFFGDFDVNEDFKELFKYGMFSFLPKQAPEYYRVGILQVYGKKFYPDIMLDLFRLLIIVAEYLKMNEYADGFILVIDYRGSELVELIKNTNLVDLKNGFSIFMDGFGYRIKGIHLVTDSKIIEILVSILKQALKKKVGNRITVNKSAEDLYKYIPRDILPVEYGGNEKSMKILQENIFKELSTTEARDSIRDINKACVDKNLIPNARSCDECGLAGTFRNLAVD